MKKLIWLFVLINLSIFAYFNRESILPSAPTAARGLNAEKIITLSEQEVNSLPKKSGNASTITPAAVATNPTVTTVSSGTSCYEWGVFSAASLTIAQSAASNLSLQPLVKEQTPLEAKRFWVYKPPLKSDESAQTKALELKALGVEELFVVQEPRWKNAISFGVFEDEQLALNLLTELKAKGVKDVVKALRNQGKGHASLIFNALSGDKVAELQKLKPDFPEANLKEVPCN